VQLFNVCRHLRPGIHCSQPGGACRQREHTILGSSPILQFSTFCAIVECLAGIYDPAFIAANQEERADNVIKGSRQQQVEVVRQQIRQFKQDNAVDKVIILWTANTERYAQVRHAGVPVHLWNAVGLLGVQAYAQVGMLMGTTHRQLSSLLTWLLRRSR
jgi:hypothetical protein